MLILRQNPRGGKRLKNNTFPLHQDEQGNFGILIGYDQAGDKLLIPIGLAEQIADQFARQIYGFKNKIKNLKPYVPIKERLAIWLLGKEKIRELKEEIEHHEI